MVAAWLLQAGRAAGLLANDSRRGIQSFPWASPTVRSEVRGITSIKRARRP